MWHCAWPRRSASHRLFVHCCTHRNSCVHGRTKPNPVATPAKSQPSMHGRIKSTPMAHSGGKPTVPAWSHQAHSGGPLWRKADRPCMVPSSPLQWPAKAESQPSLHSRVKSTLVAHSNRKPTIPTRSPQVHSGGPLQWRADRPCTVASRPLRWLAPAKGRLQSRSSSPKNHVWTSIGVAPIRNCRRLPL